MSRDGSSGSASGSERHRRDERAAHKPKPAASAIGSEQRMRPAANKRASTTPIDGTKAAAAAKKGKKDHWQIGLCSTRLLCLPYLSVKNHYDLAMGFILSCG